MKNLNFYAQQAKDSYDSMSQLPKQLAQLAEICDQNINDGGFSRLEKEAIACMQQ